MSVLQKNYLTSNLSSSGCSHVGCSFCSKEEQRFNPEVFYTFALYDGRVYDITEQTAGKSKGWIMTKLFI